MLLFNFKTETLYNDGNLKASKQLDYALENRIPFMIWIGEDEVKSNKVKIKVYLEKLNSVWQIKMNYSVQELNILKL